MLARLVTRRACRCKRTFAQHASTTSSSAAGLFKRSRSRVAEVLGAGLAQVGSEITVKGWCRTIRQQGKDFAFVSINDGSCFNSLQVVIPSTADGFAECIASGGVGASMSFSGTIIESPAKGQVIEMQGTSCAVLGKVT
jgi:asparaginyl-tRNA synthetase